MPWIPEDRITLRLALVLALPALLALPAAQAQPEALTLYVAPNGSDAWSGSLATPNADATDGPLQSLAAARDMLRRLRTEPANVGRPATVLLRGGRYFVPAPLALIAEDSGTAEAPVTWKAFPRERPLLSGGEVIQGWQRDPDGTWSVHLPQVEAGEWRFRQLFVRRLDRDWYERRYRPCKGALVIAGLTDAPAKEGMPHRRSQDELSFAPGDIQRWENLEDVEVVVLHDWSSSRLRIRELDLERNIVRFKSFPLYRIGYWWQDGRNPYYCENVKAAFGNPGDWYLARPTGILRYLPLPGEDMESLEVVAPRTITLVRLTGDVGAGMPAKHITFHGLTFAHTQCDLPDQGYSSGQGMTDLPSAFAATGTLDCAVHDCVFAHLGAYAVEFGPGCTRNRVVGCRMYDLGGGGVKVGGGAPAPADNVIENNVISDGGLDHFSAHGIWSGITQRTVIRHNIVRRFLYSNVSVGWAWHEQPTACRENVVEYNHIHDAMMLLADGGAIYTLGFQPGNLIRGNHIHDVHRSKFAGSAPNNGFFFDQGSKGFLCDGNVIYRTSGKAVRYNLSESNWHTWINNVFDVEPGQDGFPTELAAQAGLEAAYRYLDSEQIPVNPAPILNMALPPAPPPGPIVDTFETGVNNRGRLMRNYYGVSKDAFIAETDETAAIGMRSLKFTDSPLAEKPFYPYLVYKPGYQDGVATVSLYLRHEPGAVVGIILRDLVEGGAFADGVHLCVSAAGQMTHGPRKLADLPAGEWVRLDLRVGLADQCRGAFDLTVQIPGLPPQTFAALPLLTDKFRELDWVVVSSDATTHAIFYVDEVRIRRE